MTYGGCGGVAMVVVRDRRTSEHRADAPSGSVLSRSLCDRYSIDDEQASINIDCLDTVCDESLETSPAPSQALAATAATMTAGTAPPTGTASAGFDFLFANDIACSSFSDPSNASSPSHLLDAALAMESGLMGEASRLLVSSEADANKAAANAKKANTEKDGRAGRERFAPGLEYGILHADAVVLLGLTHALSESYMGYFLCISKTMFPQGWTPTVPRALPHRVFIQSQAHLFRIPIHDTEHIRLKLEFELERIPLRRILPQHASLGVSTVGDSSTTASSSA
ncbi:Mitochondrial outer membrane protein IML2 [Mycena venus]|uniref:Mitochondrial outer membrane protein IML2 n=1 Tax=Mycena venus TaxID=2733690 RepID=A0A8H7CZQ4_9AGAR|nr:Mitochondrial outer membrane protein IML2 [Mycena venus]